MWVLKPRFFIFAKLMIWDLCSVHAINLFERKDRYMNLQNIFKKLEIKDYDILQVEKHKTDSALGLFENVLCILEKSLKFENKPILIFEDDVSIVPEFLFYLEKVESFILNCNMDWDTIRLGYCKPIYVEKIDDYLYRGNCCQTTCTIYHPKFAKALLKIQAKPKVHIDHTLAKISGRHILTLDSVFTQGDFGSDNDWGKSQLFCKDFYKEFLKEKSGYIEKYNKIGKYYKDSCIPMQFLYFFLMLRYYNWYKVTGIQPSIKYETKNVCRII